MSSEEVQIDCPPDPPPYPKWWDYFNGAVVAVMTLVATTAVLLWMVQATLTAFN